MKQRKASTAFDSVLLVSLLVLLLVSTVVIGSVTIFIAERAHSNPFYYFNRHMVHLFLAAGAFFCGYCVSPGVWVRYRVLIALVAFALLLMVLVPGVGISINGARRWIRLPLVTVQTSDPAKLAFILYVSAFASERVQGLGGFTKTWLPVLLLLVFFDVLLLMQPDFGSAVVITGVILQISFIAGMPMLTFLMIVAAAIIQGALLAILTPYRFMRIVSFLNPWLFPFSSGYQLTQSLMAIGRGGLWGVGLGSSLQKIFYLPEAHTDFIFAVFCEEMGIVGGIVVLGIFLIMVLRLLVQSYRYQSAGQYFYSYYCAGISAWLGLQVIVSAGVNMGLFPTKGLSMPLLSYGGTHMLTFMLAFGIVFRMAYESVRSDRQIYRG